MRIRPLLLMYLALLAGLSQASPAAALDRTLVVRGRALDREGAPLAGALISARGSATLSATTNAEGRYSLRVVIGSPASLARAPFTLEVRAEYDGRRLPFVIQGSALAIDVSLARGTPARAQVRSNAPSAALAVAAAFVSNSAPEAVIEADFGGTGAGGAPRLSSLQEVPLPGAPSAAPPAAAPPAIAPPGDSKRAPAASRDALVRSFAQRDSARRADAAAAALRQRQRSDSLARSRASARARAASGGGARKPPRAPLAATPPIAPEAVAAARRADTLRTVQLIVDVDSSSVTSVTSPRVQRIDAFSPPAETPPDPDSCACRLRGTVEVAWDRPLEQDLPVDIILTGPASQRARVELFIGSPREFHMGPLPCGSYQLELRPAGRLRYGLARGDGRIECRGSAQVRVVLTPVGR